MMKQHDPYGPILDGLRTANNALDDETFHNSLELTQPFVTELRKAYLKSPSNVDFSRDNIRAAYLLAYYPYYIEPIYEILCKLNPNIIEKTFNHERLNSLFLGAGPCPEILGLISFLGENVKQAQHLTAYLLDKYIAGWKIGHEITKHFLAPSYWQYGNLELKPLEFDFLASANLENPPIKAAIKIADIVVMQNCLNDQLNHSEEITELILNVFEQTKPGTIFLISDLKYPKVRDLIRDVSMIIEDKLLGNVLLPVKHHSCSAKRNFDLPQCLRDHLMTGDGKKLLIPRNNTHYYFAVFIRK